MLKRGSGLGSVVRVKVKVGVAANVRDRVRGEGRVLCYAKKSSQHFSNLLLLHYCVYALRRKGRAVLKVSRGLTPIFLNACCRDAVCLLKVGLHRCRRNPEGLRSVLSCQRLNRNFANFAQIIDSYLTIYMHTHTHTYTYFRSDR